MPADVDAAIDAVLAAAGCPIVRELAPPQRAMVAGFVRAAFGQATNLFTEPNRPAGWTYTDPAVLEGLGRGSMMVPPMLAQTGEFGDVTSFLDVGTGVGCSRSPPRRCGRTARSLVWTPGSHRSNRLDERGREWARRPHRVARTRT